MTIVAYKDGIMASDTGSVGGFYKGVKNNKSLMFECPEKGVFFLGFAGNVQYNGEHAVMFEKIKETIKTGTAKEVFDAIVKNYYPDRPKDFKENQEFIVITPEFNILINLDSRYNFFQEFPKDMPLAIGSGGEYADGAMEMGATAERAVEIAIKFDEGCSGGITVLDPNKNKNVT